MATNLVEIQQLYAIERACKDLSWEKRKEERQKKSVPILKSPGNWMQEQAPKVPPQSPIGKALNYSINRWEKLCRYTENGMLLIDNNTVESQIRPAAVRRRNYLFVGSHNAAQRTAMIYSLVSCCRMHGIHPYQWLKDVLTRLPMHPINRIKELLPHNWKTLQTTPSNFS